MMDMRLGTSLATCRRCCWSLACSGISLQRGSCEWSAHSKRDGLSTSRSREQDTEHQGRWRYPAALSFLVHLDCLPGRQTRSEVRWITDLRRCLANGSVAP